jgi:hypothetical protein
VDSRSSETTAADPIGASARWFAFLPGVRAGEVVDDLAEGVADTGTGVAIRTGWLPLDHLRSRILAAAPATLDAQIYAIDD